jgi:ArsR family transcriptional regulator
VAKKSPSVEPSPEINLQVLADLVKVVLGDKSRLGIVQLLAKGSQNVTQISAHLEMSQPSTSHHLALMKAARVVSVKRVGKENHYSLEREPIKPIQEFFNSIPGD